MEETEWEAIFDCFYRTRSSQKSGSKEGGLGLSIAEAIVSSYNGKIWVKSWLHKGSAFLLLYLFLAN